jgi:hypothetical protein
MAKVVEVKRTPVSTMKKTVKTVMKPIKNDGYTNAQVKTAKAFAASKTPLTGKAEKMIGAKLSKKKK